MAPAPVVDFVLDVGVSDLMLHALRWLFPLLGCGAANGQFKRGAMGNEGTGIYCVQQAGRQVWVQEWFGRELPQVFLVRGESQRISAPAGE